MSDPDVQQVLRKSYSLDDLADSDIPVIRRAVLLIYFVFTLYNSGAATTVGQQRQDYIWLPRPAICAGFLNSLRQT